MWRHSGVMVGTLYMYAGVKQSGFEHRPSLLKSVLGQDI